MNSRERKGAGDRYPKERTVGGTERGIGESCGDLSDRRELVFIRYGNEARRQLPGTTLESVLG